MGVLVLTLFMWVRQCLLSVCMECMNMDQYVSLCWRRVCVWACLQADMFWIALQRVTSDTWAADRGRKLLVCWERVAWSLPGTLSEVKNAARSPRRWGSSGGWAAWANQAAAWATHTTESFKPPNTRGFAARHARPLEKRLIGRTSVARLGYVTFAIFWPKHPLTHDRKKRVKWPFPLNV